MAKQIRKRTVVVSLIVIILVIYLGINVHKESDSKHAAQSTVTLTNVSYDPTRELYASYDKAFQSYWQRKTGEKTKVVVSNGGSAKQANSVIDGNQADVVTLALAPDITSIQKAGLINQGWQKQFSDNAAPYTSTIVFLVRKNNPKKIRDWGDLIKPGVKVITPNPKTSGGARWNYLAAWAYAYQKNHHDEAKTKAYVKALYQHVSVLDSGARDATTTFTQNGQGDVLIAWENEALLAQKKHPGQYKIVTPSISIKAEPSVAVVNKVAQQRGTTKVANAYLKYLYSKKAQRIEAQNFYRPTNPAVAKAYRHQFKSVKMVSINNAMFGGWTQVNKKHFADGGIFDQLYQK